MGIIAKYFPHFDQSVSLRRSTASVLHEEPGGRAISLKDMMPRYEVRTVELKYDEEEEVEAQWFHRVYVR